MDYKKYLKIGKKLSDLNKNIPKEEKEKIRDALQTDKGFIDWCNTTDEWSPEDHDNLKNILELNKDNNGYFLNYYNGRISYNGNRSLKKSKTKLQLSKVHLNELEKCKNDFKYFRKHYCLITTKDGLARPEPRHYQEELEDHLLSGNDLAVSFSRQSGKTVTTATYILWLFIFYPLVLNIGIVGNRPKTAREVLDKIKKILIELPLWMQPGTEVWNKGEIEQETGSRIMTDSASSDSFRGFTCAVIFCDEVAYIPMKEWDDFQDSVIPTMASLKFKQLIYTSTAAGLNHWARIVKNATPIKTIEEESISQDTVIEIDGIAMTAEEALNEFRQK